jgi:excisionase family DNA binding protein
MQPDDSRERATPPDVTAVASREIEAPARAWLRVAEAASYANLSADTIYTACERGELRHVQVGGRRSIRTRGPWIDAWLEKYTRGSA